MTAATKTRRVLLAASLTTALTALAGFGPTASVAQAATCSDFDSQAAAQEAANTRDGDGDGIYCESLPCPCSSEWHAQHDTDETGRTPASDPDPVSGTTTAPPPGSLRRPVWPLRDRRGLRRGLARVPKRLLGRARRFIRRVRTAVAGPSTRYDRDEFGPACTDSAINIAWAGNGCDTRNDILRRDLLRVRYRPDTDDCVVEAGRLRSPYTGTAIRFRKAQAAAVPVDHVFPLSLAWQMGARRWTDAKRIQLANDPLNLLAVDRSNNSSKGDSGPAEWLPPYRRIRCAYSVRIAQVARNYDLPVTRPDKRTMRRHCGRRRAAMR
ncbi:MAG: HNH endonuclease family protein [Thermoleophilaceae bacterium]